MKNNYYLVSDVSYSSFCVVCVVSLNNFQLFQLISRISIGISVIYTENMLPLPPPPHPLPRLEPRNQYANK